MAAYDFNLKFTIVHVGYEGSVYDATVLRDAILKGRFVPPKGRYLLADAGFYDCDYLIRPYAATRYHLREWEEPGVPKPQTKEELFNLRHSQLRVAVERIFGVVKKKFKILSKEAEYSIRKQIQLVTAITALYNFVCSRDRYLDPDFYRRPRKPLQNPIPTLTPPPTRVTTLTTTPSETKRAQNRRDLIATKMWEDYQKIISTRAQAVFLQPPEEEDLKAQPLEEEEDSDGLWEIDE